jgi:formylglycine-generating enzyme required for sulfatase activity
MKMSELHQCTQTDRNFAEPLHSNPEFSVGSIDMVMILGGTFEMGSPETELDRWEVESPQHQVTVPTFFMSEYPIARSQWLVVANTMLSIERSLAKSPSVIKRKQIDSPNHPVTNVNWFEAVEFCQRLSRHSGRTYRLPTEAEWEYACRAGTTTPFNCGEVLTSDLANYRGMNEKDCQRSGIYGRGSSGIYRAQTTPSDTFPPNAFGLYDLHGNVWEWCLDHWHDRYQGAPTDGSAWMTEDANATRVVRGGCWKNYPRVCRSATRFNYHPIYSSNDLGFRVVCEIPPAV